MDTPGEFSSTVIEASTITGSSLMVLLGYYCLLLVVKRSHAVSDDENSESDAGPARPDSSLAAKLKELGSDSASDDGERAMGKKNEKMLFGSDSDSVEDEEE